MTYLGDSSFLLARDGEKVGSAQSGGIQGGTGTRAAGIPATLPEAEAAKNVGGREAGTVSDQS